jgi:hypothetical protein
MKIRVHSGRNVVIAVAALCVSIARADITHTWWGGTGNIANTNYWIPKTLPKAGDTGLVGKGIAQFLSATAYTNASLVVTGTARIARTTQAAIYVHTAWTFNNQSGADVNQLEFKQGSSLEWHSSGTWGRLSGTSLADAFFKMQDTTYTGFVANMSAGLWDFTGNTGANSFTMYAGTFNMTGGKIVTDKLFRIGEANTPAYFNFGGNSELVLAGFSLINSGTKFNFQGTNAVLYIAGDQESAIRTNAVNGNLQIDGVTQIDASRLQFGTVSINEVDYTRITAIPEPMTLGLFMISGVTLFLSRSFFYRG